MKILQIPLDQETLRRLDALARRDGRSRPAEARGLLLLAITWAENNPPMLTVRVTAGGGEGNEALVM